MSQIKFVYFDVGGVLLLDYSGTNKWTEMKRDMGITQDLDYIFEEIWDKNNSRICIDFEVDTVIPELKKLANLSLPEQYSLLDDFVNRFEKNDSIWQVAKKAKERYKVGLLTNMYPRMLSKIVERGLIPDIDWDVIVDSSVVGCKKPQDKIYEIAQKESGFIQDDIFFVDNIQKHLDSASKKSWRTLLYNPLNAGESSSILENELGLKNDK